MGKSSSEFMDVWRYSSFFFKFKFAYKIMLEYSVGTDQALYFVASDLRLYKATASGLGMYMQCLSLSQELYASLIYIWVKV